MLRKTFVTAILTVALLALIAAPALAASDSYDPPEIEDGLQDAQQHTLDGGGQANRPDDSGTWYHDGLHEGDE